MPRGKRIVIEDKYVHRVTKGMVDATVEKYRHPGDKIEIHIPLHTKLSEDVADHAHKRGVEVESIGARRGKRVVFH